MRKVILALVVIVFVVFAFAACKKTQNSCSLNPCLVIAPATEIAQLESYLSSAGITTATKHCSGMYYEIANPGAGASPDLCTYIAVNYKGWLTNGTVFDQTSTTPYATALINLIQGWQKGVPLLKKGGKIRLYIPPSLGYGAQGNGPVPANAITIFDIELVDVQ